MEEGAIEVDSIERIGFPDITPELARASGFLAELSQLGTIFGIFAVIFVVKSRVSIVEL